MLIGDLGHIAVILSLIAAMLSVYAYWQSRDADGVQATSWLKLARTSFIVHALAVLGVILALFFIIFLQRYEYHYAWSHASSDLPVYYMISCFWEGQEGSFLLWIFWNTLIGLLLLKKSGTWEKPVMALFVLVQVFLVSMILGVYLPVFGVKLGSSPFILLKDALDSPIFKENPNFVPLDGNGLNPLLQNYWMVIHPPIIFLGFALSAIPFCYCIAGLFTNKFTSWIKPATVWLSLAVVIMGTGIMMGAYWAYETLNFGGYWSWDPVENAIYIPWLVLVAALHGAILVSKKKKAERHTIVLTIAAFILVLYATFLTRSGILGNSSVHSFTDLGLSGQLLVYLLCFVGIAIALVSSKWKKIPMDEGKASVLNYDFWMLLGIITLCLAAFQVLIPTSIPVYNSILALIGIDSNMAPPSNPVLFYTRFQLWFAIGFGVIVAIGQLLYFSKAKSFRDAEDKLILPLAIAILVTTVVVFFAKVQNITYILALFSCLYGLISAILLMKSYRWNSIKHWGGALSHAGMSMIIIGMVFSAGYSSIISTNESLEFAEGQVEEPILRENILVERNKPSMINDYSIHYHGAYVEDKEGNKFPTDRLLPTNLPGIKIVKSLIDDENNDRTFGKGDTVIIKEENQYYDVSFVDKAGKAFHVTPRIQNNPKMGFIASPSIKKFIDEDIYLHVTNYADPSKKNWSEFQDFQLLKGDTLFFKDFFLTISGTVREDKAPVVALTKDRMSFALTQDVILSDGIATDRLNPLFMVSRNRSVQLYPDESSDFGTKVLLKKINPADQSIVVSVAQSQRDWITLKIIRMPMINILWIGTIVLILGGGLSVAKHMSAESEVAVASEYSKSEAVTVEKLVMKVV